jgi:hypothetical protein
MVSVRVDDVLGWVHYSLYHDTLLLSPISVHIRGVHRQNTSLHRIVPSRHPTLGKALFWA